MRFTKKLLGTFASLLLVSACADFGSTSSSLSNDGGVQSGDCTLTQGFWKNHESAWPVSSLTLGNVTYTKAELLEILRTPVMGNGLISLAHQLIAAKLNVAAGADDASIEASIDAADDLIGDLVIGEDSVSTDSVGDLVGKLDAFNNGDTGPGHCDDNDDDDGDDDGDHECVCGNGIIEDGETCDDGNVTSGDGCSATCTVETPPVAVCGNGVKEAGEECDDGNLTNGDSCSSDCVCTCPVQ
jgi:cysteine-rich repeat protein